MWRRVVSPVPHSGSMLLSPFPPKIKTRPAVIAREIDGRSVPDLTSSHHSVHHHITSGAPSYIHIFKFKYRIAYLHITYHNVHPHIHSSTRLTSTYLPVHPSTIYPSHTRPSMLIPKPSLDPPPVIYIPRGKGVGVGGAVPKHIDCKL